jgi:HAD superfamily hydrolase (TIGR01509 family)
VLFDMDGVLLESYEAWFQVVNAAARQFGKPEVSRERFQAGWGQGVDADLRDFFPGCTQAQIERYYEDHLLDHGDQVRADLQSRDVLIALRDANVPRAVITNTPTFLARDMLAWTGLIGLVDATVGAGEGHRPKPAPDLVLHACEALEVQPAEVLVVGDSGFDQKAAEQAGARFAGLRMSGKNSIRTLTDVLGYFLPERSPAGD